MLDDSEQRHQAEVLLRQTVADAHDAAFEAGLAYPFLDGRYSERRRELAQKAQEAAHEASQHALIAEQTFYRGDYSAVGKASQQVQECLETARAATRLATIDQTELGRCPQCMTRVSRLSAKPQPANSLDDGTLCWMKRFHCSSCGTFWQEIYTVDGLLIERVAEA